MTGWEVVGWIALGVPLAGLLLAAAYAMFDSIGPGGCLFVFVVDVLVVGGALLVSGVHP